jgi:hypothetical protein
MCGIAGFSGRFDRSLLDRMSDIIRHRGPDDADSLYLSADGVGLAHRRLSIIDVGPPLEILVYIAPRETDAPPPNPEYKRLILSGAWHWQLPQDYCTMLEKIETGTL